MHRVKLRLHRKAITHSNSFTVEMFLHAWGNNSCYCLRFYIASGYMKASHEEEISLHNI